MLQLVYPLRRGQATQAHQTEIAQREPGGQSVAQEHRNGLRQQDLAAVGGMGDACRTIDFATEEVVVAKFLDTDMHTAACPQRDTVHRFAVREGELELHHRRNRVERIVECRVHSVTGHFDQRAAVIGYRFAGHKIVHCERTPHPLRLLIPQLGTVL